MAPKRHSRLLTDAHRREALALHHEGKTYREIVKLMNLRHPLTAKSLLRFLLTILRPRSRPE